MTMRLSIVLPAYNEEAIIRRNALKVYDFITRYFFDFDWRIIIADNNSSDRTHEIASQLAKDYDRLKYLLVKQEGKGNAIRTAWNAYDADVFVFMDADLAADLSALPKLVRAVSHEGYDIACGSRFHKDSLVRRSFLRTIVSRGYRMVAKIILHTRTRDLPCGFKAISRNVRDTLLPQVRDGEWFFDSELIILAEKRGLRIKETPVLWKEYQDKGRKSKVRIFSLAFEYIRKVFEMKKRLKNLR